MEFQRVGRGRPTCAKLHVPLTFACYRGAPAAHEVLCQQTEGGSHLNVLVVEPGCAPYEKEVNGLSEMQAVVGGLIQAIYPYEEPVAVVCNEEGLLLGLPFNRSVEGGYDGVCGTFFVCGLNEDSFCSLTQEQVRRYKKKFYHAEILLGFRGNEPITLKVEPRPIDQSPGPRERDKFPER